MTKRKYSYEFTKYRQYKCCECGRTIHEPVPHICNGQYRKHNLEFHNKIMEREERIKELAKKMYNALNECNDLTSADIALAITCFVGAIDNLANKKYNIHSGLFTRYVYDMIGSVNKFSSYKLAWRPSTEHPQMDEEVIALVGEYNQIYFAHIVDKRFCVDYNGWNIPDVRWWIPCPKIEED